MSIKESSNKKEALERANQLEKKEKKENMKEDKAKFLEFEAKLSNRDLLFSKAKKEFAERNIELNSDKIYFFKNQICFICFYRIFIFRKNLSYQFLSYLQISFHKNIII